MAALHSVIRHPVSRWTASLSWTALVLLLMLSPASEGTNVRWLSKLFGGTEVTDAVGHVILYGVLTVLWQWTFRLYAGRRVALLAACGLVLTLGISVEFSQRFVVDRGSSLLDFGANISGVGLSVLAMGILWRRRAA